MLLLFYQLNTKFLHSFELYQLNVATRAVEYSWLNRQF